MANEDTYKLLGECNAGIKMGVDSIAQVLPSVGSHEMKKALNRCKDAHQELGSETHAILNELGDTGKEPNPIAKSMSWMKTGVKLAFNESDSTIADLMTDGCNMGVKSLGRYLNKYETADPRVKSITRRLIDHETQLALDMRAYL